MKILLVNTVLGGGASLAARRLLDALLILGLDARLLLLDQAVPASHLAPNPRRIGDHIFFAKLFDRLPLLLYKNRLANMRNLSFSASLLKSDSADAINAVGADVVNLHWTNYGHVSPEGLAQIKAPVVWTAHDMWPFTGGCHHSGACERYTMQCGRCPILGSTSENDWSSRLWRRKHDAWAGRHLSLVSPSNWLADRAKRSSLFADRRVSVIPNPLNLDVFSPGDKADARKRLGLPADAPLLLFGSAKGRRNPAKGFSFLAEALRLLAARSRNPPHLAVLGSAHDEKGVVALDVPVHFLGERNQDDMLAAYRAADVYVHPSMFENLSNMIAESLACGTPSVAFAIGGNGDLVRHGANGYLARPFDAVDLALGIETCLDAVRSGPAMGDAARRRAETLLNPSHIARAYLEVFRAAAGTTPS